MRRCRRWSSQGIDHRQGLYRAGLRRSRGGANPFLFLAIGDGVEVICVCHGTWDILTRFATGEVSGPGKRFPTKKTSRGFGIPRRRFTPVVSSRTMSP